MQNRLLCYIMNSSVMKEMDIVTEHEELEMWKSMYLRLLQGTAQAVELLTRSEEAAEALYIEAGLPQAKTGDAAS